MKHMASYRRYITSFSKRAQPPTFDPQLKIGLLGVSEDRNSSFCRGPAQAPALIRQYFTESAVNTWCELGFDVAKKIVDYGDVVPPTRHHKGIEEATAATLQRIMDNRHIPLTLGGDHSITFSLVKTIQKHRGSGPLVIVHFDAHPDIYADYEGDQSSHACPFARILEVPGLCSQLISIGVRTISGEQIPLLDKYGVEVIEARHFPPRGGESAPS